MPTAKKPLILIVDDEKALVDVLTEELRKTYEVLTAANGRQGFESALQNRPDLILLDVMMPLENGLETCQRLREDVRTSSIPVLMLTANSDTETLLTSFQHGADDFIEKPFRMQELKARIESKLRRRLESNPPVTELGNLKLLEERLEAEIAGERVVLSALEFSLLKYFVKNESKIIARPQILADVWKNVSVTDRTVDAHLVTLRKKLATFDHEFITVYGAGYMLQKKKKENTSPVARRVSN